MYIMTEETIFNVGVFYFTVGFHIVSTRKLLPADRTLMTLRPMNVGVMPTIRHDLVAADAAIQGGQRAGQLHEQRGVVDIVVATVGCGCCSGSCGGGRICVVGNGGWVGVCGN